MDIYSTHYMAAVVRRLKRPSSFLIDTFFPGVVTFDQEEVNFDVEEEDESIIPYCSPLSEGTPMRDLGFEAKTIRPPYMKPKSSPDPRNHVRRLAGERIGGNETLSQGDRAALRVAQTIQTQVERMTRTKEKMAGELLSTGKLTLEGENYPLRELDFGRDALLSKTLIGANRWGEAGVSPYESLQELMTEVFWKSGATPTDVVMTPEAFALWTADPLTKEKFNQDFRGGTTSIEMVQGIQEGATLQGVVGQNQTRVWTYMSRYKKDDGTFVNMLPDYGVLVGSEKVQGWQLFGAIIDDHLIEQSGSDTPISGEIVFKTWVTEDPGRRHIMGQSAFVPALGRPDASAFITVR